LRELFQERDCLALYGLLLTKLNLNLDVPISMTLPLSRLIHLQRLSLRDNLLQSVDSLANLDQLTYFDISYNNVKSLTEFNDLRTKGFAHWRTVAILEYCQNGIHSRLQ